MQNTGAIESLDDATGVRARKWYLVNGEWVKGEALTVYRKEDGSFVIPITRALMVNGPISGEYIDIEDVRFIGDPELEIVVSPK